MTANQRRVRESVVGLLLIAAIGVAVLFFLWINRFRPDGTPYIFQVGFADADGLAAGAPVRLRGVNIGMITKVTASLDGVVVEAVVEEPGIILPRTARYTVGQRGLIGETFLEILPDPQARKFKVTLAEFQDQCQKQGQLTREVVCPGSQLTGESPTRVQDLVRSLNAFAQRLDANLVDDLRTTIRQFGALSTEIGTTAREISVTAKAFTKTANSADQTLKSLSTAGSSVSQTAEQISDTVRENRSSLAATLASLSKVSKDLSAVTPVLAQPEFKENLTKLARNAAESAENLRRISDGLADPATIESLRETLDAARGTFRNAEKISADIDEITGDRKFRANLKKLVEGLGQLVSTMEDKTPQPLQVVRTQ